MTNLLVVVQVMTSWLCEHIVAPGGYASVVQKSGPRITNVQQLYRALNAILEVWDLFPDDDQEVTEETPLADNDQLFLAISEASSLGLEAPRTTRFVGVVQNKPLLILVNSGSSPSFLSHFLRWDWKGCLKFQFLCMSKSLMGIYCHALPSCYKILGQFKVISLSLTSRFWLSLILK
jgi:hypothetical protein